MCMDDTNWTFYNSYFYFFGGSHQGGDQIKWRRFCGALHLCLCWVPSVLSFLLPFHFFSLAFPGSGPMMLEWSNLQVANTISAPN